MAAPTPSTWTYQSGHYGILIWHAQWTDTTNMSDTVVIDLSAEDFTTGLNIEKLQYKCSAGIDFLLEFDATTDEFLFKSILGDVDGDCVDFTQGGKHPGLFKQQAGGTGDLIITTTSAAANDEIYMVVYYRVG